MHFEVVHDCLCRDTGLMHHSIRYSLATGNPYSVLEENDEDTISEIDSEESDNVEFESRQVQSLFGFLFLWHQCALKMPKYQCIIYM